MSQVNLYLIRYISEIFSVTAGPSGYQSSPSAIATRVPAPRPAAAAQATLPDMDEEGNLVDSVIENL